MKVSANSWHFRLYCWMEAFDQSNTSVCKYWGTIFVAFPFCVAFFILLSPLALIVYLMIKCGVKFPLDPPKLSCPLGKIEVDYTETNPGNSNRGDDAARGDE